MIAMWYDRNGGTRWDFWGWADDDEDINFNHDLCKKFGFSFFVTEIDLPK